MGILERTGLILRANINDLLNRAEDPEKLLNQIIADMEDALRQGKTQVAEQIAQLRLIEADYHKAKRLADEWGKKAELAVSKNADDLAREALNRKNDYLAQVKVYEKQSGDQNRIVGKLKSDLTALESKYDEARRNKDMLVARAKRAEAQKNIAKIGADLKPDDLTSVYARMERKVATEEARVAGANEVEESSVDAQFAALERGQADYALEDQLAALKKKMGKGEKVPA